MRESTIDFRCHRCQRTASAIFSCPERALGRCSFVLQWARRKYQTLGGHELVGLGIVGVFAAILLLRWAPAWLPLPTVIVLSAVGLTLWALSHEAQLCHAELGTKLQRTTLAGFTLCYRWLTRPTLLPMPLELPSPLRYPLSIVCLAAGPSTLSEVDMQYARHLLRAALIGLLVKGYVRVHLVRSELFFFWQTTSSTAMRFELSAVGDPPPPLDAGALEVDIFRALIRWPSTSRAQATRADRPGLYDLVLTIENGRPGSYSAWLVERVALDAVDRRLGRLTGMWFWRRLAWDASQAAVMARERDINLALSRRLYQLYPDFSDEVDRQLLKAINAREPSD